MLYPENATAQERLAVYITHNHYAQAKVLHRLIVELEENFEMEAYSELESD